jgi:hypothetical protein
MACPRTRLNPAACRRDQRSSVRQFERLQTAGPHVRIIVSSDGLGGLDWFVKGAWFDNHYTLRRGQLFYNGAPCVALGDPWPNVPRTSVRNEIDK